MEFITQLYKMTEISFYTKEINSPLTTLFGHQTLMDKEWDHITLKYKMMEILVYTLDVEKHYGQLTHGIKEELHLN